MTGKSKLVELHKKKYAESLLTLHQLKCPQCKVECRIFSHKHRA